MSARSSENEPTFYEQVYALVRQIPEGKVLSYGRVAQMLWRPRAARAVGYALRALRFRQAASDYADVPWQRVVAKDGQIRVGTPGVEDTLQAELLRAEGVEVSASGRVVMQSHLWEGPVLLEDLDDNEA